MTESEQLTEMWHKGKLDNGLYYVKDEVGFYSADEYVVGFGFKGIDPSEVICLVPSYRELIAMKEENAQLKKLLKECQNKLVCYKPYDKAQLLKKIDQVLGDKTDE